MKQLACIIVTIYVLGTAAVLILAGIALMALPVISAHYRTLQISDVHVYFIGTLLFTIGMAFIYGITPDTDETGEEERLALPEYATA